MLRVVSGEQQYGKEFQATHAQRALAANHAVQPRLIAKRTELRPTCQGLAS